MGNKPLEEGLEPAINFDKRPEIHPGLVPVVLQDDDMPDVIACGYESAESFAMNMQTRRARILSADGTPFFGNSGGHLITNVRVDCDQDALVYLVKTNCERYRSSSLFSAGTPTLKEGILVPAIAQEYLSGDILMLGYANQLAVDTTMEKKMATFWSTSRNELWTKGETSGNVLRVRAVTSQHNDAVLYLVDMPKEGACHTKTRDGAARRSCFYRKIMPIGTLEFLPGME